MFKPMHLALRGSVGRLGPSDPTIEGVGRGGRGADFFPKGGGVAELSVVSCQWERAEARCAGTTDNGQLFNIRCLLSVEESCSAGRARRTTDDGPLIRGEGREEELLSVVAEGKQSDAVLPWVDSKECTTLQVILGLKNGGANVFSHGCGAHIFSADLRLNQTDCNGISRSSDRHAA